MSLPGKPTEKKFWLKTQLIFFFYFFSSVKSETSDLFVNHFDGHFAYLKTLDFNDFIVYAFHSCLFSNNLQDIF